MKLTRYIAFIIVFSSSANEGDYLPLVNHSHSCTIVYALNGLSYVAFNQQIDSLRQHVTKQKVALIDLNQWQSIPPHKSISGREKSLLRKHLTIPRNQNIALLYNKRGQQIKRYESGIDLVDLLMTCTHKNK